jgi:hypothetical protein
MSRGFSGVALGALIIGLVGANEAKADAIAFASLDFSAAFFSAPGSTSPADLSHVTFNNVTDILTNSTGLDSSSGSTSASRNGISQNVVDPSLMSFGSYSGGQNNFGFTTNNTNFSRSDSILTGNLKQGDAVADVVAETQVLSGHTGTASTLSTSTSNDNFTANSNLTLQLNVAGSLALYTKLYNSSSPTQQADASVQFTVTLTDLSSQGQPVILSFAPPQLNTRIAALGASEEVGSNTANPFFYSSSAFTLIAHDHYSLSLTQEVQTDASATAVPEPATVALFGVGLVGLGILSFRRRNNGAGLGA